MAKISVVDFKRCARGLESIPTLLPHHKDIGDSCDADDVDDGINLPHRTGEHHVKAGFALLLDSLIGGWGIFA